MANGDTPWTFNDHDRWMREVYATDQQEADMRHAENQKAIGDLRRVIYGFGTGIFGTLLLIFGGVAANLWVALAAHR